MEMTAKQKHKLYRLSGYIANSVMPCYPEGFLLNPKTLSIWDSYAFAVQNESLPEYFYFPIDPVEIFSWINKNSNIILSGKCFLKGWKNKDFYFLAFVQIKQSYEMQLIALPFNSFQEAA